MIADSAFKLNPSLTHISACHFNQDPLHQIGKIFSKIICLKLVFNSSSSNCENNDENMIDGDWNQLLNDCSLELFKVVETK